MGTLLQMLPDSTLCRTHFNKWTWVTQGQLRSWGEDPAPLQCLRTMLALAIVTQVRGWEGRACLTPRLLLTNNSATCWPYSSSLSTVDPGPNDNIFSPLISIFLSPARPVAAPSSGFSICRNVSVRFQNFKIIILKIDINCFKLINICQKTIWIETANISP